MTETNEKVEPKPIDLGEYKYGFHDDVTPVFSTGKGISEDVVRAMSAEKGEPEWMLEFRLKSLETFKKMPMQEWGPDLSEIDFDDLTYFQKASDRPARDWEDVPEKIKETFERIGIPEAERAYLAGASAQYESEVVYHNMKEEYDKLGIIFTDTDSALKEYPELFKKYFSKLVPPTDNKFAALNSAFWSGGTFIYVPKGVKVDIPLQTYFRINNEATAQFERTLIIVDEGASVHYVEGCTAPTYTSASLHAAIVEIFALEGAYMRYSTIQNWSDSVYNLVTKRATAKKNATVEWIDGNLGAKKTMKYPSVYLDGEGARGTMLSIAFANAGQHQDTGAKMIHNAPHTSSSIVSKSIARNGGKVDYRGQVTFNKDSKKSGSHIECDTILMDDLSKSDTIPFNEIHNSQVALEHEAKVSKISEEQLYYLSLIHISRLGLFLAMQYPAEIPGITNAEFIRAAMNAGKEDDEKISVLNFITKLDEKMELLGMREEMAERYLNEGFSGGEKKRNEILQLLMLEPKFALLDEIDSGLDIDALKVVSKGVNAMRGEGFGAMIITHYQRLLNYITPDVVHVMMEGKVVLSGGPELAARLEQEGYAKIAEELGYEYHEEA